MRLGVDPGLYRTALAVVEVGPPHRVVQVDVVENEKALERTLELARACGVQVAVVERTTRGPWHPRVPREDLLKVAALGNAVAEALKAQGVRVVRPLAVRAGAWYGGQPPGWRQRFTGLVKPGEGDVFRELLRRKQSGELKGRVPGHPGIADALGMALSL